MAAMAPIPPMTTWTILKAAHPESANLTLPGEVQQLLDLGSGDLGSRSPYERDLVFLSRTKGWLRVLPASGFREQLDEEAKKRRIVARAPFTATSPGSMLLNLPVVVAHYLGVKDVEGAEAGSRAPMDSIAWIAPKEEWEAVRWKKKAGPSRKFEPHVYLVRDVFEGALPGLEELEAAKVSSRSLKREVWERTERFHQPPERVAMEMFRRPAVVNSFYDNADRKWTYAWTAECAGSLERRWKGELAWKRKVRFRVSISETVREDGGGSIFVSRLETHSALGRAHELMSSDFYRSAIDWEKELDIRTAYARESLKENAG